MLEKIQTLRRRYITREFIGRFQDIRFIGQLLFVVVVLLISWSGVKAIDTNYSLQKQISALQQKNDVQALENKNLELQNEYYNSNQYLELSARQNFSLAKPGEKELVVPASVAQSYITPEPKAPAPKPNAKQPFYERNFEAWVNFFLHRDPTEG